MLDFENIFHLNALFREIANERLEVDGRWCRTTTTTLTQCARGDSEYLGCLRGTKESGTNGPPVARVRQEIADPVVGLGAIARALYKRVVRRTDATLPPSRDRGLTGPYRPSELARREG